VFPGVAVIDALEKRWQLRIVWIGSKGGVERRLLENLSLAYLSVPSGKWRRYLSLLNFADLFRVVAGFVRCLLFFFKVRPLLVFSKGGYVSVPPVLAAKLLRIPVFTHESDLSPGLATRINARFSERILTSFDATRSFFPPRLARRVLLTGNPIREFLRRGDPDEGRRLLGCPQGRLILLILGGSQGSSSLNALVGAILADLTEIFFVVHQMGGREYRPSERAGYFTCAFLGEEMPHVLAAASLVISRAGAASLAELAALRVPAVLVPLPKSASRGDQIENATYFASRGAAVLFREEAGTPEELLKLIINLGQDGTRLEELRCNIGSLGRPGAASEIARLVEQRIT
jgi:UDP-N-acetylglucosamine--N-acetylmuramyl-(pentapeptide) pyrophosphoryl-undecaprenol N-acetylglucosamine transferase